MDSALRITCGECGREQAATRQLCELCGQPTEDHRASQENLLEGARSDAVSPASIGAGSSHVHAAVLRPGGQNHGGAATRNDSLLEAATYLAIGIPLALVFSLTPLLKFMGWFLAALFHEAGHSALAWFTGHPSVPAISLQGHAAAVHGEPTAFIRFVVIAVVTALCIQFLSGTRRIAALTTLAIVYPILIWTRVGESAFLVSGHFGELAAAALCLWRAADGEACHSRAERAAYAMLGWTLCGDNIILSFGLAFSPAARAEYAANGSFGLTNDYIRLANEFHGVSLGQVAFLMGALAVAVPIVTLGRFAATRGTTR